MKQFLKETYTMYKSYMRLGLGIFLIISGNVLGFTAVAGLFNMASTFGNFLGLFGLIALITLDLVIGKIVLDKLINS